MATNNPHITALRSAIRELRQAPMLAKAPAAETVAALSLVLLEEIDRRLGRVELSVGELTNLADRLAEKIVALERRGAELADLPAGFKTL